MGIDLEQLADEIIETDFLIVGGGLAGCMAAIRARQKGSIDVAIMEKSVIRTSGEVIGLDHLPIQHPAISGVTVEEAARWRTDRYAGLGSPKIQMAAAKDYLKPIPVLEEIGVKIREDDGTIKMVQHQRDPGKPVWHRPIPRADGKMTGDMIYYRGADLKEKLAGAAVKGGARVFNRTMLTGLITRDGAIAGATGVNVRTGKFLIFKAKAVMLSTGGVQRMYLYPFAPFPTNLFYGFNFPGNHGGGTAAAYRAGARLTNMEFVHVGIVSAGFPGGGGMFWKMKNSKGELIEDKYPASTMAKKGGLFPPTVLSYMPDMRNPEIERDVFTYDSSKATEDEIMSMLFTNGNESPHLLKFNKARGLDPFKTPPIEIRPLTVGLPYGFSGIMAMNDRAESSIKNLFIAGDVSSGTGGGGPNAITWGYKIGEYVRETAPETDMPRYHAEQLSQVSADRKRALAPLERGGDMDPLEMEEYIRKVNTHYIHVYKTEARLRRAIELHTIARERFAPFMGARNPHELMRVLEVQDIIDLSEIHAYASALRKETRLSPCHYRVDYPDQDDVNWRKVIVIENKGGEMKHTVEVRE
jgi:succinate dehydrogenase/fumarate reductase flavoprotein subunit